MPDLLLFAACDKAIIDDTGVASLIILMQGAKAFLDASGAETPKNAVGPKEWAVFALWRPLEEDRDKSFVQVTQVMWPDGTEFQKARLDFTFRGRKDQQNRVLLFGFPIGQTGNAMVNIWLEANSQRVGDLHSWPILVEHQKSLPSELENK